MTWDIAFSPFIPVMALWALAAFGVLLTAFLLWRRTRGALLRAATYALLLLALANPHLKQEEREPLSDIVAVVVDDSQSQRVTGRTARIAEIEKQLTARFGDLSNLEIRWIRSSGPGTEGEREGTALFGDLTRALANVPMDRLAGVVFVTDGRVHDAPDGPAPVGPEVPLHTLIAGNPDEFDRRIEIARAPRFGLVGGVQTIELKVVESGTPPEPDTSLSLAIRQDGKPETSLPVRVGETIELPVTIDHAGPNIVELEVETAKGELTPVNNRSVLTIEGVRENLRVLLVSGEPHAGERTWRNLLKSDAAVDLVHFTILRPPEKQDGTPINQLSLIAFPTRELFSEKLNEFDLVIFDRYQRRGVLPLLYLDNVARYVQKGGAVLVSAGDDYSSPLSLYRTPLAQILPAVPSGRVIEQAYRPGLTELGNKHPVTHALPGAGDGGEPTWGHWFRLVDAQPDNAEVLMHGPDDKPLLVLGRRGEGRVALLLSDHTWLWARGFEGGGPYTDLLRRLAHWLMKEPDLEEEVLHAVARGSSVVIERRSMKDEVEPVVVTKPSGETETVTLEPTEGGMWRAALSTAEQGVYHLKSGDLTAIVNIGAVNPRELAEVTATDGAMKPAIEASRGGQYWLGREAGTALDLPRIAMLRRASVMHGNDWIGLHKREAYSVKGVRLIPLFSGFLALALLLGAIALTWFREGR